MPGESIPGKTRGTWKYVRYLNAIHVFFLKYKINRVIGKINKKTIKLNFEGDLIKWHTASCPTIMFG